MLEERCLSYYQQGYNCAEAMIRAANQEYGLNINDDDIKLFAGYGLGMGSMLTCGLATVGVAIYSRLAVKTKAHETPDFIQGAHRYMEGFAKAVGSSSCAQLRQTSYDKVTKCQSSVQAACRYTQSFLTEMHLIKK